MRGRPASPLLVIAALAGAAPALAATPQPGPAAPAAGPTMMIVEFPRGVAVIGLPARCPGSTEEDSANDICFAELYEGRAIVVRHLIGPRIRRHERVRLTAHARRWQGGTRMLVVTWPFDDRGTTGHFATWWHLPEADGDFCVAAGDLAEWGDGPVTRQFARGYRRRFHAHGYLERADFRCIRGERSGAPSRADDL
jgi:hypothetical protein